MVKKYRTILKNEVNNALKEGKIHRIEAGQAPQFSRRQADDFPQLKHSELARPAPGNQQMIQGTSRLEEDRLGEILTNTKNLSDSMRRMEAKIDEQAIRVELQDKRTRLQQESSLTIIDLLQQMINALVEKKNKEQLYQISEQLNTFKQKMLTNFAALISLSSHQPSSPLQTTKQSNQAMISNGIETIAGGEQDHIMNDNNVG